jgi:hypothetical protein
MKKVNQYFIDVEIDGITNSIENAVSGDRFPTDVLPLRDYDLSTVSKKQGWLFNWLQEFKTPKRELYKLTIAGNPSVIQGIMSVTDEKDHYYLHLIESAAFNVGKNKLYIGVPGNLFAYACKLSKDKGYKGFVSFTSKTRLIEHYYKSIGAIPLGRGPKMIIYPEFADKLILKYF